MSQVDIIAGILEREGRIDNFRSIREKISVRLAARIADLRERGWDIETVEQEDKNTVYVLNGRPALPRAKPKMVARIFEENGRRFVRMMPAD